MALAIDPDGAVFGVWEHGTLAGGGGEGEDDAMALSEVSCNQTLVNAALYTAVFGLSPQRLPADGIEYCTFHDGEPAVLPFWMPYFTVNSLDATNGALKKHDEAVVYGRIPAPTAG